MNIYKVDGQINLYVVQGKEVNPFTDLDQTVTIQQIECIIQTLKSKNIKAIINCKDDDQFLKSYGFSYLNMHINFDSRLEEAKLFIHFWTQIKKSSIALYCDDTFNKSTQIVQYYMKYSRSKENEKNSNNNQIDWNQIFDQQEQVQYKSRFCMPPKIIK